MTTRKYCFHCRKDTHNDSKCWSTRAVPAERLAHYAPVPPNIEVALNGLKTPQWLLDKMRKPK